MRRRKPDLGTTASRHAHLFKGDRLCGEGAIGI
jgi:hypothetical protein